MIIIHDIKTIFIHNHRTGGSSIGRMLFNTFGHSVTLISQHGNYLSDEAIHFKKNPDYFVFGFVRNPWERLVSWYSLLYKNQPLPFLDEKRRFESFLKSFPQEIENDPYFHLNQLDYFPDPENSSHEVQFCRYENFQEEIINMYSKLGVEKPHFDHVNGTQKKPYQDYYTNKTRKFVEENCKRDIEFFDYSF